MRALFVTVLLASCVGPALANDSSVVGIGGSWSPLKGEHPSVRMVRETVRMDVYRDHYNTDVHIEFRNNGPARTVAMGFPESGAGDISNHAAKTGFLSFTTFVDGRRIAAWRQPDREQGPSYDALWIKKVRFGRGQTRQIRVNYKSPIGTAAGYGLIRFASYSFTGGNWQGDVAQSRLIVTLHTPGTSITTTSLGEKPLKMQRRGNRFSYLWRNWQAQSEFSLAFSATPAGWLSLGNSRPFNNSNSPVQTISMAGRVADFDFAPPAFTRRGTTFVALSRLQTWFRDQADKQQQGLGEQKVKMSWNQKARLATLCAGRYKMKFGAGRKAMQAVDQMNGRQSKITLPAVPFIMDEQLYVPLAPILKVMHGSAKVNAAAHRLDLMVPEFTSPR